MANAQAGSAPCHARCSSAADRIALHGTRVRIRILAREIGRFVESLLGHADLRKRHRNAERADQFEQQRIRVGRELAAERAAPWL
ncbi:putative metalloprotease [Paraburkholderia sp. WSM4179]|nr:putative metalloprotease [Paraburkholderia sp. WSM4179]